MILRGPLFLRSKGNYATAFIILKKKTEFVNVKVLLTVNNIDSLCLFLLWTPFYTSILAFQLIREQKESILVHANGV